ncbi:MAG: Ig-like domain-containing protein [Candidatus Zixiibacteriota bacterium]
MKQAFLKALLVIVVVSLAAVAGAQQSTSGPEPPPDLDPGLVPDKISHVTISGVPAYLWHHGCGPTALGMVVGYYDGHGYPELIPGDAFYQTVTVNAVIAEDNDNPLCNDTVSDHYRDYACPIDYSPELNADLSEIGGGHIDNCLADFMKTSWSSSGNYYGWSWFNDMPYAFTDYVRMQAPEVKPGATGYLFSQFSWEDFRSQIDLNRPVVLLIDTDGNTVTDHFVTAIGYDRLGENYALFNTWDRQVHWYQWRAIDESVSWGIYGAVTFIFGVPDVVETLPAHNDDGIDVDADIEVVFDVSLDTASVTASSVYVYAQNTGVHACDYIFDSACTILTIDPVEDFDNGERVTVYLLKKIASTTGAFLTDNFIFTFYTNCCEGWTGNVDCSVNENPDITDVTILISHLYLRKQPLCCFEEADIDGSGGEPDISDITRLIDHLYLSYNPTAACQ